MATTRQQQHRLLLLRRHWKGLVAGLAVGLTLRSPVFWTGASQLSLLHQNFASPTSVDNGWDDDRWDEEDDGDKSPPMLQTKTKKKKQKEKRTTTRHADLKAAKKKTKKRVLSANVSHPTAAEAANLTRWLKPRAFNPLITHTLLPCLDPSLPKVQKRGRGLLFQKPFKVGSSTAAGIHLRIARNVADRQNRSFPACYTRWHHGSARRKYSQFQKGAAIPQNNNSTTTTPSLQPQPKKQHLLWSIVREPTSRILSYFYHFQVTWRNQTATAQSLKLMIAPFSKSGFYIFNHYLRDLGLVDPAQTKLSVQQQIQKIIDTYDFIAVTERMDESLVALAHLWHLPLADVLYLSAKTAGKGYDGGGHRGACYPLAPHPKTVPPDMQAVIDSPRFQEILGYDRIIYDLVNRSLDLTIDERIGRAQFEQSLQQFRHALTTAKAQCAAEVRVPCSNGGYRLDNETADNMLGHPYRENETDCLAKDSGCGFQCLDDVASQLGLWEPYGELHYHHPAAFGMAESTRTRLAQRGITW